MKAYKKQAKAAFEIYLKRGTLAKAALEAGDIEEALNLLFWRNAAFQNFKVAFELLNSAGIDLAHDEHFKSLHRDVEQINGELDTVIGNAFNSLRSEQVKTIRSKDTIKKFHSGSEIESLISNPA